jgi:uncharacterized protein
MNFEMVDIQNPEELNLIFGMSHFIKTVEDIHEAIVQTQPSMLFGLAFCEASGPRLIRSSGNDNELRQLAIHNASKIGAGHSFIIFMKDGFPINILNTVKMIPEVCRIFCATANPVSVLIAKNDRDQKGVMGVLDGFKPLGVETDDDVAQRIGFLRTIGYKIG